MKKTIATLMLLAFGASTSFAQNIEPVYMPSSATHSMKIDAHQVHQASPKPRTKRIQPAPHHKQATKKYRKTKQRKHQSM